MTDSEGAVILLEYSKFCIGLYTKIIIFSLRKKKYTFFEEKQHCTNYKMKLQRSLKPVLKHVKFAKEWEISVNPFSPITDCVSKYLQFN